MYKCYACGKEIERPGELCPFCRFPVVSTLHGNTEEEKQVIQFAEEYRKANPQFFTKIEHKSAVPETPKNDGKPAVPEKGYAEPVSSSTSSPSQDQDKQFQELLDKQLKLLRELEAQNRKLAEERARKKQRRIGWLVALILLVAVGAVAYVWGLKEGYFGSKDAILAKTENDDSAPEELAEAAEISTQTEEELIEDTDSDTVSDSYSENDYHADADHANGFGPESSAVPAVSSEDTNHTYTADETTALSSLQGNIIDGAFQIVSSCSDVYGRTYHNSIAGNVSEHDNIIEYQLDGVYQSLEAIVIRDSNAYLPG